MSKLSKRAISTLVIAILLISTIAIAIPVSADVTTVVVTEAPDPITAGGTTTITVTVTTELDAQAWTGTITVTDPVAGTSTADILGAGLAAGEAVAKIYPTDFTGPPTTEKAGTYTISATASVTVPVVGTGSFVVDPEVLNNLAITGYPTTCVEGIAWADNVIVSATDTYGNVIPDYIGIVQWTSNDPDAVLPADYTFLIGENGVHAFAGSGFTLMAFGTTKTITVTDTIDVTVGGSSDPIEVLARGSGFSIDLVLPSGDVDYGDPLTVTGSGVTAGSTVELYWDFVTAASQLNTTTGLPSGDFECIVKVPSAYYGNHYIWAKDLATGLTTRSEAIPVIPKIKLSPSSGLEGDNVIIKGYGFSKDSDIIIKFSTSLLATDGTDETDELGYFEYTFKVGAIGDGIYPVTADDPVAPDATADFTVGAAITLDKEVGPAGTLVKVEGRGFDVVYPIETEVAITLENSTGNYAVDTKDGENIITSGTGTFTAYVVIPSVEIGDYKLTINGGAGKVATAEFEVDGETSITVTPGYGTPGTVLHVEGYNFTRISGTDVKLSIGSQEAETTTDASGSFTATITIPPLGFGHRYPVIADDGKNCHDEELVLVALIVLQLSEYSAPVGSKVILMGSGFTQGEEWNATIGDMPIIETTSIESDLTYFSHVFYVPSLPIGPYTIYVRDIVEEIVVGIDFTVTDPAELSVSRTSIPNGYNLTIKGTNFAENVDVSTQWWIFNSTDAWNLNDEYNVTYGGPTTIPTTSSEEDEEGTFTGYYEIPEFLELGSYTINCTTVSHAPSGEDWEITQYAEVDIELVPEEIVINVGGPSYARGQTITFVIKTTLQKAPFYLGIKDPEGAEFFNSTWDIDDWKTLGSWYYIPSNLQIDVNTEWLYTLPADAMPGTWTYSFWDEDKEYKNGTFQVTQLTEIEQLQVDIGEIIAGIEGMGASNTELAALVADLQGASAEAVAAAATAAAAAGNAQEAAEAAMEAISDVDDTAGAALVAANDAKDAADRAKDAADAGLAAALDAVAKAQESADAANEAREAADANRQQTSGLTGLVYGAIGASLIAALAAIVSLMQISRRIAG